MIRLRSRNDFQRVRRTGKSWAHPLIVLLARSNGLTHTRIGLVASKSVGGAVQRNHAKRRMRAELNTQSTRITSGWDLVFVTRRPILDCSAQTLSEAVTELLLRAGFLHSED